jgi:hypothetical protein
MVIYLSLLVAVVGLIVYILSANPKVQALSLWAWGAGLLAFLMQVSGGRTVGLLGK